MAKSKGLQSIKKLPDSTRNTLDEVGPVDMALFGQNDSLASQS